MNGVVVRWIGVKAVKKKGGVGGDGVFLDRVSLPPKTQTPCSKRFLYLKNMSKYKIIGKLSWKLKKKKQFLKLTSIIINDYYQLLL